MIRFILKNREKIDPFRHVWSEEGFFHQLFTFSPLLDALGTLIISSTFDCRHITLAMVQSRFSALCETLIKMKKPSPRAIKDRTEK